MFVVLFDVVVSRCVFGLNDNLFIWDVIFNKGFILVIF